MKLVFICAPYRAPTQGAVLDNITMAANHGIEVINYLGIADVFPLIPHCNTALFDYDDRVTPVLRQDDGYWLKGTSTLMSKCDMVYCPYSIYELSSGMTIELGLANKLSIPICHSLMDLQSALNKLPTTGEN